MTDEVNLAGIMAMLKEMTAAQDAETRLNRADHEEFRQEFARNRADHAELSQRFTRLEVLFEQFAHDAKVYGEGIQGINQRLEAWQAEFDGRVTSLEMRMGSAGGT